MDTPPTEGRAVTTAEAVAEAVLAAMEAKKAAKQATKSAAAKAKAKGNGHAAPTVDEDGEPLPVPLSDAALGEYWVKTYGSDWRYVPPWNTWLGWEGDTWQEDKRLRCKFLAVTVVRAAAHWPEAMQLTPEQKRKLSSMGKAGSCLAAAQCNPAITAATDQWDCDPWLLGVPGGVVDLRTGELHDGRREDYIRLRAAVAPADPEDPDPVELFKFLERTQPDPEVRAYLRRLAGYCLTGSTREQILAFFYGGGANGKSTFINTLSGILGGYGKVASMSTFSDTMHGHPEEIARLQGARMVSAEETGSGGRWDEQRIKELTGGTKVNAHFMRMNSFEFVPQFKLVFAGNHLPQLRAVSEGMRRRLHLVPWSVQIPERERDPGLGDKLRAEWPAILRWAIQGCLEYQEIGLNPPEAVLAASRDYMEDEDTVSNWRTACTVDAPRERVQSSDLYKSYCLWVEAQGEKPMGQKALVEALMQQGCGRVKSNGVRYLTGIALRAMEERLPGAPERSGVDWD